MTLSTRERDNKVTFVEMDAHTDNQMYGDPLLLRIDTIGDEDSGTWDEYVSENTQASIYHLYAWRAVIRKVFGHETIYLCARRGPRICGILPMIRLRTRLFGDYLVSMPYFNYGGVASDSTEVAHLLMQEASRRAQVIHCSHVEFRDVVRREPWPVRTDKVCMLLTLPEDEATLWQSLGAKLRAQVRRPEKEGASVVWGGIDYLPEFYSVFSRNMRDLGTPVYSRAFFQTIMESFPKNAYISLVRYRGKPVAAGLLLGFRDRLEIPWASSIREYNSLGVNMLMYWHAIRKAVEMGYRVFDFGRSSRDSGTYRFKKQWGAQERPLYWHYALPEGQVLPYISPDNPKYRLAIRIWQHLPMAIANRLGPIVVRGLP
jgi:serine/alanine adding enzyme